MDQPSLSDREFIRRLKEGVLGGRYLYLVHDGSGRITDFLNADTAQYSLIVKELREKGSLAGFYDLSGLPAEGGIATFFQRTGFKWDPSAAELHSHLPQTSFTTRALGPDLFLGRMNILEIMPNISSQTAFTCIFADLGNDRLAGFTSDLHRLFRTAYPSPASMIDLPLSHVLSPTPTEFQHAMAPDFCVESAPGFLPFYEKDFAKEEQGRTEEVPVGGEFEKRDEGLFWQNKNAPYSFITLLKEFSTEKHDFTMELAYRNLEGRGPYMVLGDRYLSEDRLPDNSGYLAGRAVGGPDRYLFKRNGFKIWEGGTPAQSQETRLTFCKTGQSLLILENGKKALSYYDSDFMHRSNAFLTLGLRQGHAIMLKKLTVLAQTPEAGVKPVRHTARLKTSPERHVMLDRFYNLTLNGEEFRGVAGFFLNDITHMQERIDALDRQYRAQVRSEERLRSMLRKYQKEEEFIGEGRVMVGMREAARTAAQSSATVLIEGPTGSGKEVLARFIHENSDRSEGPFIKVDCSTIPANLIESHLFGHEKGAFTGAVADAAGMLEKADTGTLFLDEAGNLTMDAQAKLLRFLNDFTFTRIGGTEVLKLNVRCLVASNSSLEERVKAGLFREDLFYRINVVTLRLPALKNRMEDIPALSRSFLSRFNAECGKKIAGFTPQAVKKLSGYSWPGNIRELKNVIHRAVIFCQAEMISPDLLTFPAQTAAGREEAPRRGRSPFYLSLTQKEHVLEVLKKNFGHVTKSAKELDVARGTLYKFIKAEKIKVRGFRKGLGGR